MPDPVFDPVPEQVPEQVTELDCRGQRCPLPVIKLAAAFVDVALGHVVAVVADDPAAGPDIQAWCRMKGQQYAGTDTATDGTPRYLVRRVA